jgi:hypothetical protein
VKSSTVSTNLPTRCCKVAYTTEKHYRQLSNDEKQLLQQSCEDDSAGMSGGTTDSIDVGVFRKATLAMPESPNVGR